MKLWLLLGLLLLVGCADTQQEPDCRTQLIAFYEADGYCYWQEDAQYYYFRRPFLQGWLIVFVEIDDTTKVHRILVPIIYDTGAE